jgi:hypothetical protein
MVPDSLQGEELLETSGSAVGLEGSEPFIVPTASSNASPIPESVEDCARTCLELSLIGTGPSLDLKGLRGVVEGRVVGSSIGPAMV